MDIEIAKMSSKGQVVIPQKFRADLDEDESFLVFKNNEQIILKPASKMDKQLSEDLEFAKRTEESYKRIEKGEFLSVDSDNLLDEMNKW